LKQIVAAARTQTLVIILSEDVAATEAYLFGTAGGPAFTDLNNVIILPANYDSVWMRDYGANPAYGNEVDDLFLVDWIYNRPTRPNDNSSPHHNCCTRRFGEYGRKLDERWIRNSHCYRINFRRKCCW
jgi:hypothetical protein